jgi:antitoxin VapB
MPGRARPDSGVAAASCQVYTWRISISENCVMPIARIFQSGNSQAVRLPKEFRFKTDQVEIFRQGDDVVLREKPASAAAIYDALAELPADFLEKGRGDTPPQKREPL